MSLINDALKRARQLQKKQPQTTPEDTALQPVETASSNRRPSLVIVVGALAIFSLGCWFLWQSFIAGQPKQAASVQPIATNKPPSAAKSSLASNLTRPFQAVAKLGAAIKEVRQTNAVDDTPSTSRSQTVSAPAVTRPVEPAPANPSPAPASAAPSAPKMADPVPELPKQAAREPDVQPISRSVTFPALKLQGIYLRLSRPSVLINSRTLFLGDEVEGVRIVGIERHSVKVAMRGATNELFLK